MDFKQVEKELNILADHTRLHVLQLIYQGEQCGCDLINSLDITQPTLSYHLKILSDAGFIHGTKEKNKIHYRFNEKKLEDVFTQLTMVLTSKKDCDI